ncbi:MAG: methyltransferase [Pseudomonadota bacterium]
MVATPDTGQPGRRSLAERFYRWRTGLIADASFQAWALRIPLTRPFVRREAGALYDVVAGFVYAQILFALVELDVLAALRDRPATARALAHRCGLGEGAMTRLCQGAAAIGLLRRRGDRYGLTLRGASVLGAPGVVEMVRHHRMFYADLADPVALLRGERETALSRYWSYVGGANTHGMTDEEAAPYSALMAVSQRMVAEETLAAFPLDCFARHLDVGGGEGAFLEAALAAHPHLRGTLFDLPAVVARAPARFEAADVADRVTCTGGSFLDDPLPAGADLISLVRVCYDHDDDVVRALLAKVYRTLPQGGTLLISEPMSGGARPTRAGDAYFGLYTAAMSTGKPRSAEDHRGLLKEAGFADFTIHRTRQSFVTQVVSARKP